MGRKCAIVAISDLKRRMRRCDNPNIYRSYQLLAGIRRSLGRCCKTQDRGNRERKSRYLKEGDKVYEDGYRHRYVQFLVYHVGDNNNSGY